MPENETPSKIVKIPTPIGCMERDTEYSVHNNLWREVSLRVMRGTIDWNAGDPITRIVAEGLDTSFGIEA